MDHEPPADEQPQDLSQPAQNESEGAPPPPDPDWTQRTDQPIDFSAPEPDWINKSHFPKERKDDD